MNFKEETKRLNIHLTSEQVEKFATYYRFLIEENQKMNLTAITEESEVYRKHFLDSLYLAKVLPLEEHQICDVGSGAGFPAIPYAIVCPESHWILLDSLNKRVDFLKRLVERLELPNVEVFHMRAEDYAKENRASFEVVTARAVAKLSILAELCLPLVREGGVLIAMKGSKADEEIREARIAIERLGGMVEKVLYETLPEQEEKRVLIVIRKIHPTPLKYPRSYAKIKERPIQS